MILVLLGTQNKPFLRLLKKVEKLKKDGIIKDDIKAQIGSTNFKSKYITCFDYVKKDKLLEYIKSASIIITHAGVGTIIECLNENKKVIVVPRKKEYKEHTNNHQVQIAKEFEEKKYVISVYNLSKLDIALSGINDFKPKKYTSNNEKFKKSIVKYIDNM